MRGCARFASRAILFLLASIAPGQEFTGPMPQRIQQQAASPISCGQTVNGVFTSSDNIWYGVFEAQAYVGPVQTWDLSNGVTGTATAITYTSADISSDLIIGVYFPPDGSQSVFHRAGTFSFLFPQSGLYKIGAGGSVGGHYTLRLDCSIGGTPNLFPYQPSLWSDKIIVLNAAAFAAGSTTDSSPLNPTDTLYARWAVANGGTGATTTDFFVDIYVDGNPISTQYYHYGSSPLLPGYYSSWPGIKLGLLTAGNHTIQIIADSTNAIPESNKGDNTYTKTITIQGAVPTPTPTPVPTPTGVVPRAPVVPVGNRGHR